MLDRIGYALGVFMTITMAIDAATAHLRGHDRADDVVAHAMFAGIGAVAVIDLYQWFPDHTLWAFLVPAVICLLAGIRGFELFWVYAVGYAIAGGIAVWGVISASDRSVTVLTGDEDAGRH